MEYRGAIHSGLGLLVHEIIHQWFATSILPRTNADSWLMEAIVTWLELRKFGDLRNSFEQFYRARDTSFRPEENSDSGHWDPSNARGLLLSRRYCPSPHRRELCEGFSFDWYQLGPGLFDQISNLIGTQASGDLAETLREFYVKYNGQYVSTPEITNFLYMKSPGVDWSSIFSFAQ